MYRLVKPTIEYEDRAYRFVESFYLCASDLYGSNSLDIYVKNRLYDSWVENVDFEMNKDIKKGEVPTETYFLVDENDEINGITNIRFNLDEDMDIESASLGYSIDPIMQGKGLGKIILYLTLLRLKELNIDTAYLEVEEDNERSIDVISSLGGEFIAKEYNIEYLGDINKYKINVNESLISNKEKYELLLTRNTKNNKAI